MRLLIWLCMQDLLTMIKLSPAHHTKIHEMQFSTNLVKFSSLCLVNAMNVFSPQEQQNKVFLVMYCI